MYIMLNHISGTLSITDFIFRSPSVTVSANVSGLGRSLVAVGVSRPVTYLNIPSIALEDTSCDIDLVPSGSLPFFSTPGFFLRSDNPVNSLLYSIDDDPIAVLDQRDRTSQQGLRDDMTNDESSRSSRETTVSDQRCLSAETGTHQSTSRPQHLSTRSGVRDRNGCPSSSHTSGIPGPPFGPRYLKIMA